MSSFSHTALYTKTCIIKIICPQDMCPNNPREGGSECGVDWGGDETSFAMSWQKLGDGSIIFGFIILFTTTEKMFHNVKNVP